MAMGRWSLERELWIATEQMSATPRHVFYERLNQLLGQAGFDAWLETLCGPYYAEQQAAYRANHRRIQGARGKRLLRRRGEVVERTFAHLCETGGGRRTW